MSPPGQVVLVFEAGPRFSKRHLELPPQKELVCGRPYEGNKVDIPLQGYMTSRRHALIRVERDCVSLLDLETPNGTFMNDQQLGPKVWTPWPLGTVVRFGCSGNMPRASANGNEAPSGCVDIAKLTVMRTPVASTGPVVAASLSSEAKPRVLIGPQLPAVASAAGANGHGMLPRPKSTIGSASAETQQSRSATIIGPQLPPQAAPNGANGCIIGLQQADSSEGLRGVKRPLEEQTTKSRPKCDKCDQGHPTECCPHFKKSRENHKDAWLNYGRKHPLSMGRTSEKYTVRHGKVVQQPGDGSCLFHSLCFGLNGGKGRGTSADILRKELMNFISSNPRMEIAGDTLEEWIKWDTSCTVSTYTKRMRHSGWGGGIEMAACSILHKINVHVYEGRKHGEFERISCFDAPKPTPKTIHVLYKGGMHFDALLVR